MRFFYSFPFMLQCLFPCGRCPEVIPKGGSGSSCSADCPTDSGNCRFTFADGEQEPTALRRQRSLLNVVCEAVVWLVSRFQTSALPLTGDIYQYQTMFRQLLSDLTYLLVEGDLCCTFLAVVWLAAAMSVGDWPSDFICSISAILRLSHPIVSRRAALTMGRRKSV
jgi:hypothetical protein